MNIFDFEYAIMPVILKRGQDYFRKEKVDQLMQVGPSEYVLEVEGTDIYEVFVEIDVDFNIVMSDCSCPYDLGPHCKHEVAAYLAIRKELEQKRLPLESIKEQLTAMEKSDLVDLMLEFVQNDDSFHMQLSEKFKDEADDFFIDVDEGITFETFNMTDTEEQIDMNVPDAMTDEQVMEELKKYPLSIARVLFLHDLNAGDGPTEGRNIEIEKRGLQLQVINGYTNFLPNLASYYREEEWPDVLRDIAKQMKEQKGIDFWAYERLIEAEGLEDELLAYCQQFNEAIERHYDQLNEQYPEEVKLIFRKLVMEKAAAAKNRSHYERVCELLELMQYACDFDVVLEIVDELMEKYPRKRVFIEMLEEV